MLRSRINSMLGALKRRAQPLLTSVPGRALRRALDAGLFDSAASLSYYLILSLIPCITLIVGLIGVIGKDPETADSVVKILQEGGAAEFGDALRGAIEQALNSSARSGTAIGIGLLGTLYVASLYVSAFTRAAAGFAGESRRSRLRSRPIQVLATFTGIVLLALALLLLVASKKIADALANETGIAILAEDVWPVTKWVGVVVCLFLIVAGLYSLDPTRQRRWPPRPTLGTAVAVGLWLAVSIGFEVYLRTLASYDETYGAALGGVITFMVWAWLTNMALLFGLALDQERRPDRG